MSDCGCEQADQLEKQTLIALLTINGVMFVVELIFGIIAQSTGLLADSLDMLADALVYGLSLYAVGQGLRRQAGAARVSGYLQLILGLGVLLEVVRRWVYGSEPQSLLMISVALGALVANVVCLAMVAKHRHGGVHMRASWIFSANDVIANIGVMLSGVLVAVLGSRLPDLLIGSLIAALVMWGGGKILREAHTATQSA
ncbi:hypothetical protein HMF8227_00478 [Saliniradius amylolyticus]|uniref:Cation efflux protein transmembrane domain-containing protein n=1 Tax=Saliniradius amylolyticus TaxID=2183582 RepID=A0A2S2DZZ9_9ALTE|nr:cation transporter [Saliniradius amylolyticus]AWL10974.1 hypothetical protein HMF8227_00478 [Saliniradius amylolyticus]